MKSYEKPVLTRMDDIVEGVYANSGSYPPGGHDVPPRSPFHFDCKFADFNCGSYSSIQFLAYGVNVRKISQIILNILCPIGGLHNMLDLNYMRHYEMFGHSGCVSGYQVKCLDTNTMQVILNLNGQNESENVEFKFRTEWNHDFKQNPNNNFVHGSYNGLTNDNCNNIRDLTSHGCYVYATVTEK